ncbi:hypothetical protein NYO67_1529 [Aspergillus flavus]|nr:hypothetical protein NYO67_1529 [Aspergillus flavus]
MNGIFFSPRFWWSRLDINEERDFLYRAVRDSSDKTRDGINWQHLYHCTFTFPRNDKFDEMVKLWETFRWIRHACLREETAHTPFLNFHGRSLQHCHGTRLAGTKVETVDISPELAKVGVSILYENDQYALITGLAFYRQDGSCEVIGYKIPGARALSEKEMTSRIQYRCMSGHSSMSGKLDLRPLQEFYRPPGFHVLMDAKSLEGFPHNQDTSGIHG